MANVFVSIYTSSVSNFQTLRFSFNVFQNSSLFPSGTHTKCPGRVEPPRSLWDTNAILIPLTGGVDLCLLAWRQGVALQLLTGTACRLTFEGGPVDNHHGVITTHPPQQPTQTRQGEEGMSQGGLHTWTQQAEGNQKKKINKKYKCLQFLFSLYKGWMNVGCGIFPKELSHSMALQCKQ